MALHFTKLSGTHMFPINNAMLWFVEFTMTTHLTAFDLHICKLSIDKTFTITFLEHILLKQELNGICIGVFPLFSHWDHSNKNRVMGVSRVPIAHTITQNYRIFLCHLTHQKKNWVTTYQMNQVYVHYLYSFCRQICTFAPKTLL